MESTQSPQSTCWLHLPVPRAGLDAQVGVGRQVNLALSLRSPCEGVEHFCVPGTADSDWGFRGEEDPPLLWRGSQSTGETNNRSGLTVRLPQGWTPPGQTLALGPTRSGDVTPPPPAALLCPPVSHWLPDGLAG